MYLVIFLLVFILYLIKISHRSWKPIARAEAGADLFLSLFSVPLFGTQSSPLASFPGPPAPPHTLDACTTVLFHRNFITKETHERQ